MFEQCGLKADARRRGKFVVGELEKSRGDMGTKEAQEWGQDFQGGYGLML